MRYLILITVDGQFIRINVNFIIMYKAVQGHEAVTCVLICPDEYINVRDTVEEIDEMLDNLNKEYNVDETRYQQQLAGFKNRGT